MSKILQFNFKNDYEYDEDEDENKEQEEIEEQEQQSEKEINHINNSKEESSESYKKQNTSNSQKDKEKEIINKSIILSNNSISKSNNSSDNDSFNSESQKFSFSGNDNEIIENNQENKIILENILEKDKISNSIIISRNNNFINMISEKLINYSISRNKKVCYLFMESKKAKDIEDYFNGKKDIKSLFLQKIKTAKNKNEYSNFRNKMDNNNLFISNPNILYKLLSIGYIKFTDFGLIIFDDCHLCEGNHHYNLIMQEFYFYYINNNIKKELPNIIGFTNSPNKDKNNSKNKNKIGEILKNISENLNCQIVVDPNIFIENKIIDKAKIETIKFENYLKEKNKIEIINIILIKYFFKDMLNLCLKDYIKINGETEELKGEKKIVIKKNYLNMIKEKFLSENLEKYNNIETSERSLHFLSQNSILFKTFEDMQRHLINIIQNIDLEEICTFFENYKILYEKNLEKQKENKDIYLTKLYIKMINIFDICSHAFKRLVDKGAQYETDILNKFKNILNNIYKVNKNGKIIIFVSNRKIANILNSYLNRDKKENICKNKSKYIVGINPRKEENTSLNIVTRTTISDIKERINEYNQDKINILICTPSTLEYIDNTSCDKIILFNEIKNNNNFIEKIKTKLLKANSELIILSEKNEKGQEHYEIKEDIKNIELKKLFMDGDKIVYKKDFRDINFIKNKNKEKINYYYISETEAKISLKNCMMLFNEINNLFISKGYKINIDKTIKKYENKEQQYICYIKFNRNNDNVEFISGIYFDKQSAENECYMKYLMYLHQKKIIDNNFQLLF